MSTPTLLDGKKNDIRAQLKKYGEHLLQGGHPAAWQEIIDVPGVTRVDHALVLLVNEFILNGASTSTDPEGSRAAELEAFAQIVHASLHELIVHFRDSRQFAQEAWKKIEETIVKTVKNLISMKTKKQTEHIDLIEEPLRDFLLLAGDVGFQFSYEVRQVMRNWMEMAFDEEIKKSSAPQPKSNVVDRAWQWQDPFLSMLNQISEGGKVVDEFDCFNSIENQLVFLPEQTLADIFSHGLSFERSEIRELMPLMALHKCEEVSLIALQVLENFIDTLSPTGLRRLISMRNWLPASRHTDLDHVIRAARTRNSEACNEDDSLVPEVEVVKHLASSIDGSGAQNIMTLMKSKHGFKIFVGVVKENIGWIDVWSSDWSTKTACERIIRSFQKSIFTLEVSQEYVEFIFRLGLHWNSISNIIPKPEFLHWVELLHDTQVNPRSFDADDYVYLLDLDPDTKPTPFQIRQGMDASGQWLRQGEFAAGWFEAGDHVETYIENDIPDAAENVIEHCVKHVFEPIRQKWALRLYRMAFWAHSNAKRRGPKSVDFYTMAHLIHGDLPLEHLPFMRDLAMATLSAYADEFGKEST